MLLRVELPGFGGQWILKRSNHHLLKFLGSSRGSHEGEQGFSGDNQDNLSFGRGGIRRIGELVLRPYRRGGWIRHFNDRIYASPRRFEAEWEVHSFLFAQGFPTVEPLGYAFRPRLWGVEGVYLTRYTPAEAWPKSWNPFVIPQIRNMIQALCALELWAPDLNATNFLVDGNGQVLALDWDRARPHSALGLEKAYYQRLARSLKKLGAPEEIQRVFQTV